MTYLRDLQEEPWRFDFFSLLRRLERTFPDRPRIGEHAALREEYASLGQEPYLDFPASNLSKVERLAQDRFRIFVKFLGLLGPQGALPLATTEEAYSYALMRDDAFPRFLDLFNNRFLQLFFRAWANARPIAQHDRPEQDAFITYIGAMIGVGSSSYRNLDSTTDTAKLAFAGLIASQAKGASRLRGLISGFFGVEAEIEEFVPSYLKFDPPDRSRMGESNSRLGVDLLVGASAFTIQDKFRVRVYVGDMEQYVEFLPSGNRCEPLTDLIFFYVGDQFDWELELALPAGEVEPVRLSQFGRLGWTSWMAPSWANTDEAYRCDARFNPVEIVKQRRERKA